MLSNKEEFMKRLTLLISALICALCCTLGLAACNDDTVDSYYNLTIAGEIYFDGEQTVSLSFSENSSNVTTFKESVTVNDISLSGVLAGKTVKSVNYEDPNTLRVVLTGKVSADGSHSNDNGTIIVSHTATQNGADACGLTKVNFAPKMSRTFNSSNNFSKKYTSEFTLPYGSFIKENVNTDKITVMPSDITVNVSVTDDGALRIETVGFEPFEYNGNTYDNPVAKLDACVTTFNKELYVGVGDRSLFAEYALT